VNVKTRKVQEKGTKRKGTSLSVAEQQQQHQKKITQNLCQDFLIKVSTASTPK